ncbi:MAG: tRNA methyl transferase PRC-barrel domain-containing protein, partial [Rikenellaceae bacterium]
FLCQLSQAQLSKSLFPIGNIEKPEVRRIATELGLATAKRKDSQGICFVGKVDLPIFLQQKLKAKKGAIIEIANNWTGYAHHYDRQDVNLSDEELLEQLAAPIIYKASDGVNVGEHNGAHFYTVGQRKGLGVGGKAEPLFVIATDVEQNIIYVGQGQNHKGLYRKALFISKEEMHWIRPDMALPEGGERHYNLRIRYRQPLQGGTLRRVENGLYMVFNTWQRGVTAGQFATWYSDEQELVGSGVINK